MAKKHIRLTFYYTDEKVWDYIKRSKTRDRLVKWANAFYDRYDFKIYDQPITYNEKVYKKKFVFAKRDGIKVDYTIGQQLLLDYDTNGLKIYTLYDEIMALNSSTLPQDQKDLKEQQIKQEIKKLDEINSNLLKSYTASKDFELDMRKLIFDINKGLRIKNNRLPVVFAEFKGSIDVTTGFVTTGEKLDLKLQAGFLSWALLYVEYGDVYEGPMIVMDYNAILTKRLEYGLAHEIVHAAGNTTLDNQGTPKNIMIYADAENKSPTDVNLEPADKTRLEAAFFVV